MLVGSVGATLAPAVDCSGEYSAAVVIYGGTAGGVVAAVAAARNLEDLGNTSDDSNGVLLLSPSLHLGGMVSSGLGWTDGTDSGGIAAEAFLKMGGYHFAPSTAERVFDGIVRNESSLKVIKGCRIASVEKDIMNRIVSAGTSAGGTVTAKVFIDATYEGDLMPLANISYRVGREAVTEFNESLAGRLPVPPLWGCLCNWDFKRPVDGRNSNGNPLPMIQAVASELPPIGSADKRVQSYNFRLCLTQNKSNLRPFPGPSNFSSSEWELLRRVIAANADTGLKFGNFFTNDHFVAPGKTDSNNAGGLSTDYVGGADEWPEADHVKRQLIWERHKQYTLGLYHFLTTDPVVPSALRREALSWGLCADEFVDTAGWPHQLYVREARRLQGAYTFTQNDRVNSKIQPDSIAVGAYNIDGHITQRVMLPNGTVTNEGCLSGWANTHHSRLHAFEIPYRVLVPQTAEATNLLVTCAISATHVGSASLRLEPQYMNMGHAAGVAATLIAVGIAQSTQTMPITRLQTLLVQQGVRINSTSPDSPRKYLCVLGPEGRCLEAPSDGNHSNARCDGRCQMLGSSEWMGSVGAWRFNLSDKIAVALKDTHLKKSIAPSSSLPPGMALPVAKGTKCILNVYGGATWDGLFFCSKANTTMTKSFLL